MGTTRELAAALLIVLVGCDGAGEVDAGVLDAAPPGDAGTDAGGPPPFEPDSYCPGAPGCESGEGGTFEVGVARAVITPTIDDTTDVMTLDVDGDGEYEPLGGDTFENRDGEPGFSGVWIAGFGNARPASGVADDVYASAVAMRNADTTIVLVSIDVIGWFKTDMDRIREMVADLEIDHIAIAATHVHQNRDTIGLWGIDLSNPGRSEEYNDTIRSQAARAIRDAVGALQPANVQWASVDLRDVPGGLPRLIGDNRDPVIIDPEVRVMRLVEAGTETTICTVINFGAHPEYLDDQNTLISGDLGGYVRRGVSDGVIGPDGSMTPGVGGITIWMNAAVGGQIGPNHLDVRTWAGDPVIQGDDVFLYTRTVGEQLAHHILTALGPTAGATTDMTAALGYRTRTFFVDVENSGFHVALLTGLFDRESFNWDPGSSLVPGENEPDLLTEVTVIDIGRASMITAPGELDPSLLLGGYDGEFTPMGVPIVDPANPNPPPLDSAPPPPYLRDLARTDADQVWLLGMTNDYLGYLVPEYNYQLHPGAPYFEEAPGDHYEETNSVGVNGWPTIRRELEALLAWSPGSGG